MGLMAGLKGAVAGVRRARQRRAADGAASERAPAAPEDARYCTRCGHVGRPAVRTPGSIWIELVLWLCWIVPGLVYSLWRHHKRHDACAACGSPDLIPADAPLARAAAKHLT